jgi:hypothetical protein
MEDREYETNEESEQDEDEMICSHAEKLEEIKYGIIAKIFQAGSDFARYDLKCRSDKKGLSHDKEIELQTRLSTTLDNYYNMMELIWDGDYIYEDEDENACKDCQDKLDGKLGVELKDILDKKKNSDGKI